MATVNFTVLAADNLSQAQTQATMQPLPITGDNGTVPADIGASSLSPAGQVTAQLKAIVGSPRNVRTYTLTFKVTDPAGNTRNCTATVVVRGTGGGGGGQ
jgi:hypothetical protein